MHKFFTHTIAALVVVMVLTSCEMTTQQKQQEPTDMRNQHIEAVTLILVDHSLSIDGQIADLSTPDLYRMYNSYRDNRVRGDIHVIFILDKSTKTITFSCKPTHKLGTDVHNEEVILQNQRLRKENLAIREENETSFEQFIASFEEMKRSPKSNSTAFFESFQRSLLVLSEPQYQQASSKQFVIISDLLDSYYPTNEQPKICIPDDVSVSLITGMFTDHFLLEKFCQQGAHQFESTQRCIEYIAQHQTQ